VNPLDGLKPSTVRELVELAGLDPKAREGATEIILKLYDCYISGDADLVEINPLVLTTDGQVRVLDAKVTLDDDAAFRHPEWAEIEDMGQVDERERLAKKAGLQYVGLDGTVGIIANGAGLAMSTVDVVNQVGGSAANFLDIGGGADAGVMASALGVINADPKVRAILVNIFGGIVRCDDIARGILAALEEVDITSQIVLRLDGTNATEARRIIAERASEKIISEPTMLGAARRAVAVASAKGEGHQS
jgi:succinyl-CoA synthetase beta subunit